MRRRTIKTRGDMDRYLEGQLERLGTDHIDCYLLHALNEHLAGFDVLITYNGKTYDQPLLETRYRMARSRPPPRGGWTSAITNTRYTIIDLNSAYRARRGDTFRIETDPFFPCGLQTCFFMVT